MNAAIMELLDVLLLAEALPLTRINVVITALEEHEVDFTSMAFRMAGRMQARDC